MMISISFQFWVFLVSDNAVVSNILVFLNHTEIFYTMLKLFIQCWNFSNHVEIFFIPCWIFSYHVEIIFIQFFYLFYFILMKLLLFNLFTRFMVLWTIMTSSRSVILVISFLLLLIRPATTTGEEGTDIRILFI